jgi:predicted nucleic acid-binding protein
LDKAGEVYRHWHPNRGTDFYDAILAATAMQFDGIIYTLNTKHYPVSDVAVKRAWVTSDFNSA